MKCQCCNAIHTCHVLIEKKLVKSVKENKNQTLEYVLSPFLFNCVPDVVIKKIQQVIAETLHGV